MVVCWHLQYNRLKVLDVERRGAVAILKKIFAYIVTINHTENLTIRKIRDILEALEVGDVLMAKMIM